MRLRVRVAHIGFVLLAGAALGARTVPDTPPPRAASAAQRHRGAAAGVLGGNRVECALSQAPIPKVVMPRRAAATASLDRVHPVPDPPYVRSGFEQLLWFVNLPTQAIIRIYWTSDILVAVVVHTILGRRRSGVEPAQPNRRRVASGQSSISGSAGRSAIGPLHRGDAITGARRGGRAG
jgi:hypothetical protein